MVINNVPFATVEWQEVKKERHDGESGYAEWRVKTFGDIRVRIVEYSPGYKADHWCSKGHIVYCLEGEMTTELNDGKQFIVREGMSYQVEDKSYPHRSSTEKGATLFIVD